VTKGHQGKRVIVVGAGLSGLIAARRLHQAQWHITVLEARDRIGGRIQTDEVNGFLLDHGFQVYLTGYEVAKTQLDLPALKLGTFPAGALIQLGGRRYRVCDPLRSPWYKSPWHAVETALAPVGSIWDKLRIASFRHRVCSPNQLRTSSTHQTTARDRLIQMGFSETIIERFFKPFFAGIFLEPNLSVSANRMESVFRTFSLGLAALPADGMQAIPNQIAQALDKELIQLNTTVARVEDSSGNPARVYLGDGRHCDADFVIVATEEPAANRLLGSPSLPASLTSSLTQPATCCLYFSVPKAPMQEATLVLNGDGSGPINNLCFPGFAQPNYLANARRLDQSNGSDSVGNSLLSVSTIGQSKSPGKELVQEVQQQLVEWFGPQASQWKHLRTYLVPFALPNQSPIAMSARNTNIRVSDRVFRCGDYCTSGSIEGAIESGLNVANHLLEMV